jgi:hypothetical protein
MTANEMQVHIHRLCMNGRAPSAERIRYAGGVAHRYWTWIKTPYPGPTFACVVACEMQAIVEDHDFTTKSNHWKEPPGWHA